VIGEGAAGEKGYFAELLAGPAAVPATRAAQQRIPIGHIPIGDGGAVMTPPFVPGVAPAGELVSATAVRTIPQFMIIFNMTFLLEC